MAAQKETFVSLLQYSTEQTGGAPLAPIMPVAPVGTSREQVLAQEAIEAEALLAKQSSAAIEDKKSLAEVQIKRREDYVAATTGVVPSASSDKPPVGQGER